MIDALAAIAFVAVLVVLAALAITGLHRLLRPQEMNARSATALRELEPRGGRHRFHARRFEIIALAAATIAGLGVFLVVAAAGEADITLFGCGGGALLVALWWSWRRGVLRAVEADTTAALFSVPSAHAEPERAGP